MNPTNTFLGAIYSLLCPGQRALLAAVPSSSGSRECFHCISDNTITDDTTASPCASLSSSKHCMWTPEAQRELGCLVQLDTLTTAMVQQCLGQSCLLISPEQSCVCNAMHRTEGIETYWIISDTTNMGDSQVSTSEGQIWNWLLASKGFQTLLPMEDL